jgi:WD40 repeat protein
MSDRSKPRLATTLVTPAMLTPHESLRLNQRRGLLVAVAGNPAAYPGIVDVYSVAENCLEPKLLSSTPLGVLGHESAFSPDGRTFYSNSNMAQMAVIDLDDPSSPQLIWNGSDWAPHGASVSEDGNTLFVAGGWDGGRGMVTLDVSDINRRLPNPQIRELSRLTWPELAIPQNATPFRSRGHDYVIETDEFGGGVDPVGGARIINVDDLEAPHVVSHLRLDIHNKNTTGTERSAHYCTVPSRVDPAIIACSMLYSGLRVFDVRDVENPREVAYANFTQIGDYRVGNAYSAPAYDPQTNDVWYSDANRGLFVTHLTPGSTIKRFAREYTLPGS